MDRILAIDQGTSSTRAIVFDTQGRALGTAQHEFDQIFGRITQRGLDYWADPGRTRARQINHNDGGRGVYFQDPDGHLLEVITRPYGSG